MDYFETPALIDMHFHGREGDELPISMGIETKWCDTILLMPNLNDPLIDANKVLEYQKQVEPHKNNRNIIYTMFIWDETKPEDIEEAHAKGIRVGKGYPKGKTHNSSKGIKDFTHLSPVYDKMRELGWTYLIHPMHPLYRSREGEEKFFQLCLPWFDKNYPDLRICFEHVSSEYGISKFVVSYNQNSKRDTRAATITAHHLSGTINDLLDYGELAAHCMPPLRTEDDRRALINAAIYCERVIFGSDAALHKQGAKYKPKSRPGIWTAGNLPLYINNALKAPAKVYRSFTHDRAVEWWNIAPSKRKIAIFMDETTDVEEIEAGCLIPFLTGAKLLGRAEIL